jgi:hypothetical protein
MREKEMKKLLVAAAVAGLVGTVNAQSAFEGFYGQLGVGYENNSLSSRTFGVSGSGNSAGQTSSGGGFSGVIGVGYNFSVAPKWILGIGGDYSPTSINTSTQNLCNTCANDDGTYTSQNYKVKNRYSLYVMPGYELDKDKLVYVKAGYSSQGITYQPKAYASSINTKTDNQSGYVAGLGYKQLIDKNLYFFGEGNYYSYSKYTTNIATQGSTTYSQTQTPSAYQFLVGVGYKF